MPIKTPTPTKQQIEELRNAFKEKYEKTPPAVPFHHVDLDRIYSNDLWLTRFLEMYDLDMKESFDKLWTTCIWRQEYGAYDLSEETVRAEFLNDGVIYSHNKDIDGVPLLHFHTKLHLKGTKDMKEVLKVVVYWIERIQREQFLTKMTLFFDMDGTGLSNMDLEFIKMIIETFKQYYPNCLNYILVYEMAWILNAAFKIVKAILPEKAVEILKVIKKKDVMQFIDKDNCLARWGGNDPWQFSFVPEVRQQKPLLNGSVPAEKAEVNGQTNITNNNNSNNPYNNIVQDKKVHFANTELPAENIQMHDIQEQYNTPQDHDMLRISPQDYLRFTKGDDKECTLELVNISKSPVTYKIQTTSPEKFRVRPRCGILNSGDTIQVSILLKQEHNLSENSKDKFLIMCLPANDATPSNLAEFWKKAGSTAANVEQHRVCCIYNESHVAGAGGAGGATTVGNGYVGAQGVGDKRSMPQTQNTADVTKKLENQLKNTQILQIITLAFLILLSIAVGYLLKVQLCGDDSCFQSDNLSARTSSDFGSCVKGKTDL